MPDRIPVFKPPWINRPKRKRDARPSAAARGYAGKGWAAARREVLVRDGYQCQACGSVVHGKQAHVDHIQPKREGGTDHVSNLRTLCVSCHSKHEGWRAANAAMKTSN